MLRGPICLLLTLTCVACGGNSRSDATIPGSAGAAASGGTGETGGEAQGAAGAGAKASGGGAGLAQMAGTGGTVLGAGGAGGAGGTITGAGGAGVAGGGTAGGAGSGMSGASSGGDAGGGVGGAGGMGAVGGMGTAGGGAGGVQQAACVAGSTLVTMADNDASVVWTVTGNDGAHTDHCDQSGNLVQYSCELGPSPCPPPPPGAGAAPAAPAVPINCSPQPTGVVLAQTLDCAGTCQDATCAARCPDFTDHPQYLSVAADGAATFKNDPDPRVYSCDLTLAGANVDCLDPSLVGTSGNITGLGVTEWGFCTSGTSFTMVLGSATLPGDDSYACAYDCRFAN